LSYKTLPGKNKATSQFFEKKKKIIALFLQEIPEEFPVISD
jgi:hypothetical protein